MSGTTEVLHGIVLPEEWSRDSLLSSRACQVHEAQAGEELYATDQGVIKQKQRRELCVDGDSEEVRKRQGRFRLEPLECHSHQPEFQKGCHRKPQMQSQTFDREEREE